MSVHTRMRIWWIVVASLMAGAVWAVVGNEIALTESAEQAELKGDYAKAATARQRAIEYAQRNLKSLQDPGESAKAQRDKRLAQSVLDENKRWLAEDNAGGGKLVYVKEEMRFVSDCSAGMKSLEAKWRQAKQNGGDAAKAKQAAVDCYAQKVTVLRQKIQERNADVEAKRQGYATREIEATYMRGVLHRWEWGLAELRAAR